MLFVGRHRCGGTAECFLTCLCFHLSHHEFLKDGVKHMRLKFYVEGSEPGRKGTVHTESREVCFIHF